MLPGMPSERPVDVGIGGEVGGMNVEFRVFKMKYEGDVHEDCGIACIPFSETYFEEYKRIYNECFYEMRKSLRREPYNWLGEYSQIAAYTDELFLMVKNGEIIGSVACKGNEVDDLIVNQKYQGRGYGKKLLLWAMEQIRERSSEPIVLHVAERNARAVVIYKTVGFEVAEILTIA